MDKYNIAIALGVLLTVLIIPITYFSRGYFAIGGECFITPLLILGCLVFDELKTF